MGTIERKDSRGRILSSEYIPDMGNTEGIRTSGLAKDAKHYQKLNQQPIEIMQSLMSKEQFIGFLWGNIIKYTLRCGLKDNPVREMEKVKQYAQWYIEVCEGKTIKPE